MLVLLYLHGGGRKTGNYYLHFDVFVCEGRWGGGYNNREVEVWRDVYEGVHWEKEVQWNISVYG